MKKEQNKVQTRFGIETRFDVVPIPAVPFRGTQETALEQLKAQLLAELLAEAVQSDFSAPLRRAANEAAGLAWLTPFPLLFFPTLLEEKARAAQARLRRQRRILERSQELLETVA